MPVDANFVDQSVSREPPSAGAPQQDGFFGFYARATYDFTVQGGAISTIYLNCYLPPGTIIVDGFLDVVTQFTGASCSFALQAESAGDLMANAVIGTNGTAGRHNLVPVNTAATSVKTSLTLTRQIAIVIASGAATAGRAVLWLRTYPGSI